MMLSSLQIRFIAKRRLSHANAKSLLSRILPISHKAYSTDLSSSNTHSPHVDSKPESRGWALPAFLLGLAIPTIGWAADSYLSKPVELVSIYSASETGAKDTPKTSLDFQRAITELQTAFASEEGMVSIDEDVLHQHGFSVNDYHDGMYNVTYITEACLLNFDATFVDRPIAQCRSLPAFNRGRG